MFWTMAIRSDRNNFTTKFYISFYNMKAITIK